MYNNYICVAFPNELRVKVEHSICQIGVFEEVTRNYKNPISVPNQNDFSCSAFVGIG